MNWRKKSFLITVIYASIGASNVCAQRYNFKFYGEEEGLQNLAVQVILQDRAGFLWTGTQNGLYRYDGSRFTAFGKADGLPDARIESLHESTDGTLWVGTRAGVARRNGEHFDLVPMQVAEGVRGRQGIASDSQRHIYLATERGLVMGTPSPKGFQFGLIPNPAHMTHPDATSVYVDSKGTVWFGCGLAFCVLKNGHARDVSGELGLPPDRWEAILGDLEGNVWVRSDLALYERSSTGRFQLQPGLPHSSNTFPTLALDPSGRLLAPTFRGLARQNGAGWDLITSQDGLTTNDISAVMQDREGSIWVGLLGSGLARWLGYNEWQSWSDREGLSRESIWPIVRDARGRLWVGTLFGLNYAEVHGGKLIWRKQSIPGVDFIRSIAPARDGTLWMGADPGGVHVLNPITGAIQKVTLKRNSDPSDRVRHIAIDRQGHVWIATYAGLFRSAGPSVSLGSMQFEQMLPPGTEAAEMFHMIVEDHQGRIWVAGDKGLACYSEERWPGERWQRFTVKDGLKNDKIAHIAEDPDGSLWIGYRDSYGITRLTFLKGEAKDELALEHHTLSNGLRSEKSLFIGFDTRGWLWAGTDHGVDVFDHSRWRHYGRSDGLIWDDCNSNAFFADADGSVWIGTSRGLSRFRPSSTPPPSVPPRVVFTLVKLGDKSVEPAANLETSYQNNSLQIRFAALTFAQESNVLFRYRLAGVTPDWLETRERELNYPKLPPGQYTLEVMARSAQGLWSTEPATLSFQVTNPWWLMWWFRLGLVFAALGLGRLMWQRRTQRLEAERNRLETAVTERTRELSQEKQRVLEEKGRAEQQKREIERLLQETQQVSRLKSEFLANMSHEIRTPMNGILGMTDLVLGTPLTPEQRDYLDTARLSARSLLTILNDVLDFSKIEAGRMDLNPIEFSLRQCVRDTGKMLAVPAAEKHLTFEIEVADDVPDNLVGDPDRLRQVLLNLIGNAIKFTSEGGVWLRIERESQTNAMIELSPGTVILRFVVRDTGIGIPREKQELIFEAFRQADGSTTRKYGGTGLGLAICSRLVEMMGGKIHVESETGRGSTFWFTARLQAAAVSDPTDSMSLKNMLQAVGTNTEEMAPTSLRILLAEDNPVNQRLAVRLLEKRGHRVKLALTGREALACIERERFDLILMDVQMPDMDGLEATATIREREKKLGGRTPIIALTARTMKGDRERCLDAGMDNYINKPIDATKFLEIVETSAAASR